MKAWLLKNKKKAILFAAAFLFLLIAAGVIAVIIMASFKEEESVYKETTVMEGLLTVGITEEGTVSVGTVEQSFELDISEYSSQSLEDLFRGPMGMQASGTGGRNLTVEEVYVTVGQQVKKGAPLFKLTQESVDEIREELASDEENAKLTYDTQLVQKQKSQQEAQQEKEKNQVYGNAASLEYEEALHDLEETLSDAQDALTDAQEDLLEYQEDLAEVQEDYEEAKKYLKETTAAIESESDTYWYLKNEESREQAAKTVEDEEDKIEKLQDQIQDKKLEIVALKKAYDEAFLAYQTGEADAKTQYDKRLYNLKQAGEIYGIVTDEIAYQTKTAQEDYEDASEKLQAFDAYIIDGVVSAQYEGIVTEVDIEPEDLIEKGTQIIVLNNYEDITANVQVDDDDMDQVHVGDTVRVSFSAFPDGNFEGKVSDIGDATISSSSEVSYAVEIEVSGDVEGLYEGMTGEVTFITKETKEVTYVANRAIIREGAQSYVKVRGGDGSIEKRAVVTGFSDGSNVEIKEGLTAGETVLIESKVKSK